MTSGTQYTAEDVAQRFGIDRDAARHFILACIVMGVCTQLEETKKTEGKKGKGQNLYVFKDEAPTVLWHKIHAL